MMVGWWFLGIDWTQYTTWLMIYDQSNYWGFLVGGFYYPIYGGFHSHGGTPKWMVSDGKSVSIKGWWLGVPLFQETTICVWFWIHTHTVRNSIYSRINKSVPIDQSMMYIKANSSKMATFIETSMKHPENNQGKQKLLSPSLTQSQMSLDFFFVDLQSIPNLSLHHVSQNDHFWGLTPAAQMNSPSQLSSSSGTSISLSITCSTVPKRRYLMSCPRWLGGVKRQVAKGIPNPLVHHCPNHLEAILHKKKMCFPFLDSCPVEKIFWCILNTSHVETIDKIQTWFFNCQSCLHNVIQLYIYYLLQYTIGTYIYLCNYRMLFPHKIPFSPQ